MQATVSKALAAVVTGAWLLAAPTGTLACGTWPPKNGGQMNYEGGEVAVELVGKGRQVSLFLEDHGTPIPAAQVQGSLRVQRGQAGWSAALKPAGSNRVVVQVPQALQKGDEIVADLRFANGSITQARYVYGVDVQLRTQFGAPRPAALPAFAPRP